MRRDVTRKSRRGQFDAKMRDNCAGAKSFCATLQQAMHKMHNTRAGSPLTEHRMCAYILIIGEREMLSHRNKDR